MATFISTTKNRFFSKFHPHTHDKA